MTSHLHLIIGTSGNPLQNIMRDLKRHTAEILPLSLAGVLTCHSLIIIYLSREMSGEDTGQGEGVSVPCITATCRGKVCNESSRMYL
jgi:hypothetical protein